MTHIGEEPRLVLARLRKLPALVLDFVEQVDVLDRDHGLIGESRRQLDLFVGERPHDAPGEKDDADRPSLAQQRDPERGTMARPMCKLPRREVRIGWNIRYMNRSALEHGPPRHASPCRYRRNVPRDKFPVIRRVAKCSDLTIAQSSLAVHA